jgi:hypothetical protein
MSTRAMSGALDPPQIVVELSHEEKSKAGRVGDVDPALTKVAIDDLIHALRVLVTHPRDQLSGYFREDKERA